MNPTHIVVKLWMQCHVLRDDSITYQEYVNELSFLRFLKTMQENNQAAEVPEGCYWGDAYAGLLEPGM
ncbi:hypothetical protein [Fuerstiella marisgermanici]|uniref:Type I restriction enzyme EcoKI M protein n=1 Tax=Fuerstiella marisgermanici TaxID=1891926 RepID=A0A1P8WPA7_9PLAN|nr:hypothetical protein [Fuerstiella marisgermanici]APZ95891.1 Type I restriction enzyme EcoKI M protein [Fuerstiella marisgermanici]